MARRYTVNIVRGATMACLLGVLAVVYQGCHRRAPLVLPAHAQVPPQFNFDLNGDGTNDSNLELRACSAEPGMTCLYVGSQIIEDREIFISNHRDVCRGTFLGRLIRVIGDYVDGGLWEVVAPYCQFDGTSAPPAVAVVDVTGGRVIGRAVAPADQTAAFVDHAADPTGKKHPFLAPSYGDGDTSGGRSVWGYLCLFRPDLPTSPQCGEGFVAVSTVPSAGAFFREAGGYLQDLDGDGWEDITLIFHRVVHTISTGSASVIGGLEYDVAATTEPLSPPWFHSGRNYGIHTAVIGAAGRLRTVIVGGAPVGSFGDVFCNVSRFVAVLEAPLAEPQARHLEWSSYFGFHSTKFRVFDPQYAEDPSPVVSRRANLQDNCIHRFSDSRSVMDGEEIVIFNYFRQESYVNNCLREQYQLYLPPPWTREKEEAWNGCANSNRGATGWWGMRALRESDGSRLTGSPNSYVWGMSSDLLPTHEMVYLVESLPGTMRFDLSDRSPTILRVHALIDGLWAQRGTFPIPGRPRLRNVPPSGSRGAGSLTSIVELTLNDIDGDELADVQLTDGRWVGYSSAASRFVVKN